MCVDQSLYNLYYLFDYLCKPTKDYIMWIKEEKGRKQEEEDVKEEDVSALKRRALKRDLEYLRQSSEPGREDRLR